MVCHCHSFLGTVLQQHPVAGECEPIWYLEISRVGTPMMTDQVVPVQMSQFTLSGRDLSDCWS